MISNDQELAVTLKKLGILEAGCADLGANESNASLRRSAQLTIARLINQFKEEALRYRWGQREKVFLKRALRTQVEAENTRRKLADIEALIDRRSQDVSSSAGQMSLSSLRRMRNQLKEEVLWFDAKAREKVHAQRGESASPRKSR